MVYTTTEKINQLQTDCSKISMIYTHIPYTPKEHGTKIGYAYNKFMEMLPNDDDWGCFVDHDAMFTTPTWYNMINKIVFIFIG